jgi:hypothetical protein
MTPELMIFLLTTFVMWSWFYVHAVVMATPDGPFQSGLPRVVALTILVTVILHVTAATLAFWTIVFELFK